MNCKICNSAIDSLYKGKMLDKYPVEYFICKSCKFIQTDKPVWLNEAYSNAITQLDIGLIDRNIYLRERIPALIEKVLPGAQTILDFGGGYGILVRMMRDLGYNFSRYDIHCENIFAKGFDLVDMEKQKFDLLTAFEVFEHLENPLEEIKKMLDFSPNIIFSTELSDSHIEDFKNWWYVAPQTGQHIAFYHSESLVKIADKFNKNFYSNGNNLHLFLDKPLSKETAESLFNRSPHKTILQRISDKLSPQPSVVKRKSLLQEDYEMIKNKLDSAL